MMALEAGARSMRGAGELATCSFLKIETTTPHGDVEIDNGVPGDGVEGNWPGTGGTERGEVPEGAAWSGEGGCRWRTPRAP